MSLRLFKLLIVACVLSFACGSLLLSCGGGGTGCGGTFDAFGNFIPGACATAGPELGFNLVSILICSGPPGTPSPTPTPTAGQTPSPTPTVTPCPQAASTTVASGASALFHALGELEKDSNTMWVDITNANDTLWTTSNKNVLLPPSAGNGGNYSAVAQGCACIDASAGGISAPAVGVTVYDTSTPVCTPCASPTATP